MQLTCALLLAAAVLGGQQQALQQQWSMQFWLQARQLWLRMVRLLHVLVLLRVRAWQHWLRKAQLLHVHVLVQLVLMRV